MKTTLYILIISVLLLSFSCKKENDFSEIPFLKYVGHEFKEKDEQDFIEVHLYFNDRDGNIGLEPGDTLPPFNSGSEYYHNLWATGYLIRNGVPSDTFPGFSGRIPNLTPAGQNKSLEGDIYFDMSVDGIPPGDTMRFDFILIDRDLNKSELVQTPLIRIE